jgi:hypothetical protein
LKHRFESRNAFSTTEYKVIISFWKRVEKEGLLGGRKWTNVDEFPTGYEVRPGGK